MIVYLINRSKAQLNFKISMYDKTAKYIPASSYIKVTENSEIQGILTNYNKLSTKLVIRGDSSYQSIKKLSPNDVNGINEFSDAVLYHYDDAFTIADAKKFGDQLVNEMRKLGL